jgi:hypothetical protein
MTVLIAGHKRQVWEKLAREESETRLISIWSSERISLPYAERR